MEKKTRAHVKTSAGFSLFEVMVGAAIMAVFSYFATTFIVSLSHKEARVGQSGSSVENITSAIFILKKDLQFAQSVSFDSATNTLDISYSLFNASTSVLSANDIFYAVSTANCPEFGPTAMCKTLTRTVGSGASAPTLQLSDLVDVQWCLYNSAGTSSFDNCSALSFALQPKAPIDFKRFALSFSYYAASGSTQKASLTMNSVFDLDNVPYDAAVQTLKVIKTQ